MHKTPRQTAGVKEKEFSYFFVCLGLFNTFVTYKTLLFLFVCHYLGQDHRSRSKTGFAFSLKQVVL